MTIFFFVGSSWVEPGIGAYVLFLIAGIILVLNLLALETVMAVILEIIQEAIMIVTGLAWISYFTPCTNVIFLVLGGTAFLFWTVAAYKA